MAVRFGPYKLHLWTWATPKKYNGLGGFCPGQYTEGLTTEVQVNHTSNPILFNLEKDSAERYPIGNKTGEYLKQTSKILQVIKKHEHKMVKGKPELNWCDEASKNWSPPGCERLHPSSCLKPPKSHPFRCDWDH